MHLLRVNHEGRNFSWRLGYAHFRRNTLAPQAYVDLSDISNLTRIISQVQHDEFKNLGAQSQLAVSLENPV